LDFELSDSVKERYKRQLVDSLNDMLTTTTASETESYESDTESQTESYEIDTDLLIKRIDKRMQELEEKRERGVVYEQK